MADNELVLVREEVEPTGPVTSDAQMIDLWLRGRSPHTRRAYAADAEQFLQALGKPLPEVRQSDVQAFVDSLATVAPNTRRRHLAVVRSLLACAWRVGYLRASVGIELRPPRQPSPPAEPALTEEEVARLIALETNPRNRVLLRVFYEVGARVSEVCALTWEDVAAQSDGTVLVTLRSKGRARVVPLPAPLSGALLALRGDADATAPVFASRRGGALTPVQAHRVVRQAAVRAEIAGDVSPNALRRAHASHALARGVPIESVAATLGHASVSTTGQYRHARAEAQLSLPL
ncbi:MAG: tyrosine-type recombinase/integrase [Armatimonadetes bacterium]|jgi:site-specific recombinase XerD|nr:tyrosine-type recombinase/integrase [Armatimonadota bacterium]